MSAPRTRSKTLAAWIALVGGTFGLHRLYLHGWSDKWAWLHPWPTLAGLWGVQRMLDFGQDDRLAWLLIPVLGLMISGAMLCAILYGLTTDERWNARYNPTSRPAESGWIAIIAVVIALLLGAAALMGTLAYAGQRYFEIRFEQSQSGQA